MTVDDRPDEPARPGRGGRTPRGRGGVFKVLAAVGLLAWAGVLLFAQRASLFGPDEPVLDVPAVADAPGPWPATPDFDLTGSTVPRAEILAGGPPRDGIPALTDPRVVKPDAADHVEPSDRVVGIALGGEARAYPLSILTWHEIVNDTVGGVPVAVTYCPLCDSVAAFDRRTADGVKTFGVSGLLYNSNVLMYDREGNPQSLWSQLRGASISGPAPGTALTPVPADLTTWVAWRKRHPATTVLSDETGHIRAYGDNPYRDYFARPDLMFGVRPTSDRLPAKERVLGVWLPEGAARAYPLSAFEPATDPVELRDEIGGRPVTLRYDPESQSLRVLEAPEGTRWSHAFWFAWYAFHPETTVHQAR